jgi:hypothetical protein
MSSWIIVQEYAGQVEAEYERATLESAGIPTLLRGQLIGAFGPGFAGGSIFGIRLLVPASDLERARDVLGIEDAEPE